MDDQQPKTEDTTNLSSQYQSILDKYAADLAVKTPEPTLPSEPVPSRVELPPNLPPPSEPIINEPAPDSNNIFKILFFISLIVFLGVLAANIYTFVIAKPSTVSETTPTLTPIPTVATAVCELNDSKYQVGQTFTAQDGCNTCTCQSDQTISCTSEICPTAGPTKKPVPITVSSIYPTSGKFGAKVTLYGTGFDKTTNTAVFASDCSFFYKDVPSADGQKLSIELTTPTEIKCAGSEISPVPTKPVQLVAGSYDVSVNVGTSGSFTKAKLIKFKFTGETSATPSAIQPK